MIIFRGNLKFNVIENSSKTNTRTHQTLFCILILTGTDDSEKINASSVKYNGSTFLSSSYYYDDNGNVLTKKYSDILNFVNEHDALGKVIIGIIMFTNTVIVQIYFIFGERT